MKILEAVPLAPYTTFQIGGPAEYLVEVVSEEELVAVLQHAAKEGRPVTIIGGGSNVLIDDAGVRGCVIINRIGGRSYIETDDQVHATIGAGEIFDDVVSETVTKGYWGLENLSAIPGTVGATPIQNVGAYGVETSSRIINVTAVHKKNFTRKVFSNDACTFAYRNSFFKTEEGSDWIVTAVTFLLQKKTSPTIHYRDLAEIFANVSSPALADIREAVVQIRNAKFPDWKLVGTAGSFFKNPSIPDAEYVRLVQEYPGIPGYSNGDGTTKIALGWVLDKVCHLKDFYIGPVGCFAQQALVVVNVGGATAADVENFAQHVSNEVKTKTNISIEWEVTKK